MSVIITVNDAVLTLRVGSPPAPVDGGTTIGPGLPGGDADACPPKDPMVAVRPLTSSLSEIAAPVASRGPLSFDDGVE